MGLRPGVAPVVGSGQLSLGVQTAGKRRLETTEAGRAWRPEDPPSLDGMTDIELDFETTGLRWWAGDVPVGVAIGTPDGRRRYLPWGHRGGQNLDQGMVMRWMRSELRNKRIWNLNTKFEIHMARVIDVDLEAQGNRVYDIGHPVALLDDARRRFDLKSLAEDYLPDGLRKIEGLEMGRLADYPAGEVAAYAEMDVRLPHELRKILMPMIEAEDLGRVLELESRLMYPICEMERNGAIIDHGLLEVWLRESEQELLKTLWNLNRETGVDLDPGKVAGMVKLFELRGIPVQAVVRDDESEGGASFTDAILAAIPDTAVQLARRARKILSIRSKYLVKYWQNSEVIGVDSSGRRLARLRYALHQLRMDDGGTITGRFSASALSGPGFKWGINPQQVMDAEKQEEAGLGGRWIIRRLYVAEDPSHMIVAADARQIEYRVFAHYANSKALNDAYAQNPETDYHLIVGAMIEIYRKGLIRKYIKNTNFCKLFGGGAGKIAWMLGISLKEAKELVATYDRAFPEVNEQLERAMDAAKRKGYVRTFLGRRSRFTSPDAKRRIYKALNGVVQGGAAEIMKMKLIEAYEVRREVGLTLRMTVHDEAVGDVPSLESAKMLHEVLNRQTSPLRIPILWSTEVGPNWADLTDIKEAS